LGSSNGTREASTSNTISQLITTRRSEALEPVQPKDQGSESMRESEREPEIFAVARKPKKSAGSARHANPTSRAAPIPSKADPVSRAAAVVKKRASPKRYAKRMRSPVKAIGAGCAPSGIRSEATRAAASVTTGPAINTHVVVRERTTPFRKSLSRS
jgi:hypothetical protein